MTEDADIRIEQYSSNLAAGIAEMFNSWDDLWPGGFTSGVPYDEERVRKTYDKIRALAILIAIDSESSKPVGFCSLMQHWRDEDAVYIGLLGVSPEALSKKVGKRLLLKAMKIAIEKGYQRVDLHTWAGNLRAVPLYKKIGLMWNPEADGVHLEGFIPEILKHPLAAPFWKDVEDISAWYEFQQRELEQAPDDIIDQGMHIYNYKFENQSGQLSVIIDRLSKGITSIDCKTDAGF